MLTVRFRSQKSSLTAGVPGPEIRWCRFGWGSSGRDAGLFSGAVLVQPCVFENTWDPDTLSHDRWFTEIQGVTSVQGAVWQREELVQSGSKRTAEQALLPGLGSNTVLNAVFP